VKEKERELV